MRNGTYPIGRKPLDKKNYARLCSFDIIKFVIFSAVFFKLDSK